MSTVTLAENDWSRLLATWTPTASEQDQRILKALRATQAPAPPAPATFGGYSASHPRPASDPVGAPSSLWRQPKGAVLINSPALVGELLSGIAGPSTMGPDGRWSKPTYYAANTDPLVKLRFAARASWETPGPLNGLSVRIPPGAQPGTPPIANEPNSDSHMEVVLCEADATRLGKPSGVSIQIWKFRWVSATEATFESGSFGNIAGPLTEGTATAMENDLCAGEIRGPELVAGVIPHKLFAICSKWKISSSQYVAPARHTDGSGSVIPMGTCFALAYTPAELEALAKAQAWPSYPGFARPPKLTILSAIATSGLVIGDSSGDPFGLQCECNVMYDGAPNPFAGLPASFEVTSGVDWKGRLRAVAPQ